MIETLQKMIDELKGEMYDTSSEDARIKSLENELNRAVAIRNEKLAHNLDLENKINKIIDVKIMIEPPVVEEPIEPIEPPVEEPIEEPIEVIEEPSVTIDEIE